MTKKRVNKAVIPAAGLGIRFLPATKTVPKEMLPVVDKPTIQYVVEEIIASGIEDILIVTGRNKSCMEDHFDYNVELEKTLKEKGKVEQLHLLKSISEMADIHYVRQKEPLGLGHAVMCARKFVGSEPFAVLLGDDIVYNRVPCIKQLMQAYAEKEETVLGVQKVEMSQVHKYGIVDYDRQEEGIYRVKSLVEKPGREEAPSNIAVLGRYIIEPDIFELLKETPPGAGGEIQLTDALNQLSRVKRVWAYPFKGKRYDVGDRLGYLEATVEYALRREDLGAAFQEYLSRLASRKYAPGE